jgi:hypothetical protein
MKEVKIMIDVNDHLNVTMEKIKQLENRQREKELREKETKRKIESRLRFSFWQFVDKYLPDVDTVLLKNIVRVLADNPEIFAKLKEEAANYRCQVN